MLHKFSVETNNVFFEIAIGAISEAGGYVWVSIMKNVFWIFFAGKFKGRFLNLN